MVGRTISHYRIVARLAAGGMGVVFRAEDVRLGRDVAIKFVSEDFTHDEHAMQRLRSEARAASALNHPNICTIYDVGEDEGRPYIVMEFMKGVTLRDRLIEGTLKIQQLVDMGIEVADALHTAHSSGIVHRDIKPGNLFLTERGHVKILDFGLAKVTTLPTSGLTTAATYAMTEVGVTLGTVCYMSPEQATGDTLDGRTDIFSIGVVLYECATGHHPFPGKTSAVTVSAILTKAPVAPVALNNAIPLRLQEVINHCLEKDRELRYQSAADLRADLKRVRRDLDSGRSQVIDLAELTNSAGSGSEPFDTVAGTTAHGSGRTSSGAPSGPAVTPAPRQINWRTAITASALAVVLALIGWAVLLRDRTPEQTVASTPALSAAMQERLSLATSSLERRNYRAAETYAEDVLAVDGSNAAALRIRNEARTMLDRFDASIADARSRLSAGDLAGASRALEAATAIDPASPALTLLASEVAAQSRKVDQSARPPAAARPEPPAAAAPPAREPVRPEPSPPPPVVTQQPQTPPSAPVTSALPSTSPTPPPAAPPPTPAAATPPPVVPADRPAATAPPSRGTAAPASAATPAAPEPSPAARDDAAIRALVASYGRAIETKDLKLFRTIKPNLSAEEERRLQDGFRAVTSQRVELTITSITRQTDEATVVVRRRDTIQAGGRQQTAESQQTLALARTASGWVIVNIR